jgi:hypothetical protein
MRVPPVFQVLVGRYDPDRFELGRRAARVRLLARGSQPVDVVLDGRHARLEPANGYRPDAELTADHRGRRRPARDPDPRSGGDEGLVPADAGGAGADAPGDRARSARVWRLGQAAARSVSRPVFRPRGGHVDGRPGAASGRPGRQQHGWPGRHRGRAAVPVTHRPAGAAGAVAGVAARPAVRATAAAGAAAAGAPAADAAGAGRVDRPPSGPGSCRGLDRRRRR